MATQAITSGAAIGQLAGRAILGGASVAEVKPMMAALTRDAVKLAKVEQRKQRAWKRQMAELLCWLAEGDNAATYSPAELHALSTADCQADLPRLIAEWEAWERYEAQQVTRWEEEQAGIALQADRDIFLWESSIAD